MEQHKEIVTKAEYSGESYDQGFGIMYIHNIEFEGIDKGEYHSKSQDQDYFVVGKEVDYTIEDKQTAHGLKTRIKLPKNPGFNNSGGNGSKPSNGSYNDDDTQRLIIRQVALKAAVELRCHDKITDEQLFLSAEKINEWINKPKD